MSALSTDPATRLTRRAANLAALAFIVFFVLFWVSSEVAWVRTQSPWQEDPFDLVLSIAALVSPVVAFVTFVRVQRYQGKDRMPRAVLRLVRRGIWVALALVGMSAATSLLAFAVGSLRADWGPFTPWLAIWAGVVAVLTVIATVAVAIADRSVPDEPPGEEARLPDGLDDVVSWLERVSRRIDGGEGALFALVRPLRTWIDSPRWSPRRHPIAFPVLVALAFGIGFSGAHALLEGAPSSVGGLIVMVFYAGVAALICLTSYALLGRYLRLVVPA